VAESQNESYQDMTVLLFTTRQILAVTTIAYFLPIFIIILTIDRRIKNYSHFEESFVSRVAVALVLYIPLSAIFAYIVQPITRWLHELLNVPYP
jgi:uncharacterized membrane protein